MQSLVYFAMLLAAAATAQDSAPTMAHIVHAAPPPTFVQQAKMHTSNTMTSYYTTAATKDYSNALPTAPTIPPESTTPTTATNVNLTGVIGNHLAILYLTGVHHVEPLLRVYGNLDIPGVPIRNNLSKTEKLRI